MSRREFPFEKLQVWQDAKTLVQKVYELTRGFPSEERFGLVSQLNRASASIANNLAEGSGRSSLKDQAHFTNMAHGSTMEVACELILSIDLGYLKSEDSDALLNSVFDLSVRIHNLRNSQLRRASSE